MARPPPHHPVAPSITSPAHVPETGPPIEPRRITRILRRVLAACLLGAALPHAQALDPSLRLAQYHHTSWTAKDGAPRGIRRMAQTTDGWLWLGASTGLYRFDGVRFERFVSSDDPEFATRRISTLIAAPDGSLWVGTLSGGLGRIDAAGRLVQYPLPPGLPPGSISTIEAAPDGVAWAAIANTVLRFDGQRWQAIDASWNLAIGEFGGMFLDLQGTLWVSDGRRLHYLAPGARRFVATDIDAGDARSLRTIGAESWMLTETSARRLPEVAAGAQSAPLFVKGSSSFFVDRDRNLWSVFCPAGLCRRHLPAQMADGATLPPVDDRFTNADGLSGDIGMTVLEDREGALWVATQTGLDRFRDPTLVRAMLPRTATNFLLGEAAGHVLIAAVEAQKANLWRYDGAARAIELPPGVRVQAIAADTSADGAPGAWIGTRAGVWRLRGERLERSTPSGVPGPSDARFVLADGARTWALFRSEGLREWRSGGWAPVQGGSLPAESPTGGALDAARTLWLGYRTNRVVAIDAQGVQKTFGPGEGVDVGNVAYVHAERLVLIAGEGGVQLLEHGRFRTLRVDDAERLRGVTGIVETRSGDLWLNGALGAVRIDRAELARAFDEPLRPIPTILLDTLDGYPGSATPVPLQSTALQTSDGRLWFAGIDGIVWFDPARRVRARGAAPVQVREIVANGRTLHAFDAPAVLPPGTTSVELRYTALSLSMPERVRFSVRLEGLDEEWRDAGSRREASFSNLSPGRYRFWVRSTGDDGLEGAVPASVAFTIQPFFTQTLWFKLICGAVALALLWAAYTMRMRRAERLADEKLRERIAERERIARELHDTLLQGVHGLTLRFQKVANRMPADDPARTMMEAELERADRLIVEGRDRVFQLRSGDPARRDLGGALMRFGDELAQDRDVQFVVHAGGESRRLDPQIADEVYCIAAEAVLNAFRHAGARSIRVELRCSWWGLRVAVRDDGVGIDPDIAKAGRPGHWGLIGMRERARRIGARLTMGPLQPHGTEVVLRLGPLAVRRHLRRDDPGSGHD